MPMPMPIRSTFVKHAFSVCLVPAGLWLAAAPATAFTALTTITLSRI